MTLRTIVRRHAVDPAGQPAGLDGPRPQRRRDGGFSIVEIVITVTLMGVVVVPILAAVAAGVRASSISVASAEVENALVNAVDRVNRTPREGTRACDVRDVVGNAMVTSGWLATSATVGQEYLDPSGAWQTGASGTACPVGGLQYALVQRITITVTSPDHDVSRTLQVVRGGGEDDV